ncbi:hypothetical protein RVP24_003657 [Escherichia coli]|nr:hypothetical protein [Escherichia coli]
MSSSVKYSPVPAVLTRPELLAELNLLMTRIASGCRVGVMGCVMWWMHSRSRKMRRV